MDWQNHPGTAASVLAAAAVVAALASGCSAQSAPQAAEVSREQPGTPAADPQPARHHFVKSRAGKTYPRDLVTTEAKLTAVMTDGRYSFLDEIWSPGFAVQPHFHVEHSETFYVIAGHVEWTVNGETRVMTSGDLVYVPPDTVHSVKVVGNQDVRTLMIYEPGGYEDHMDEEAQYTPEQRRQQDVVARLRSNDDFNLAGPKVVATAREAAQARTVPAPASKPGAGVRQVASVPQPALHRFSLRGRGETFKPDGEVSEVKLASVDTDGRYSLLDEIWKPGMAVPPHYHARHAETFYILGGQVEWTVGGETQVLGAGGLVYIPPDTVHSVRVVGKEDVHTLMLYSPGGYEYHSRREAQYTPEQRKQPEIQRLLRALNDFNPVGRRP